MPTDAQPEDEPSQTPGFFDRLNSAAKSRVLAVQDYFTLAWNAIRFAFARPFYAGDLVQQMDVIGVQSLGIVLLTGFFTGMVLALQSSVQLATFGATQYIGRLVSASMIRELGPVLAGLMVAGRVGSGVAAQIGSMRVTEQIDALNTLGTDPIKKLVTPRVLAGLVMLPLLTVINDFVGILGGNIIASVYVGLPSSFYWRTVWDVIAQGGFTLHYIPNDFIQGLVKPIVFGGIIATTACYYGLATTGGTEGVGQATTRTVVAASTRGVTSFLIGSVPRVLRASICSVTRMDPIWAAIPEPTRPATISPASTGPSSRIIDPATRRPMYIVAPNWAICTLDCSASTIPVKNPVSSTMPSDFTPISSICWMRSCM
jgi:phospholipid/cholesterol/gamma-HCH transport system permease protein